VKKLLVAVLVGAAIWYAQAQRDPVPTPDASTTPDTSDHQVERDIAKAFSPVPVGNFSCDGRTRCTEMRSCDEAEFFLKRCPGVKMDGDGDGIPCEDQHCSYR
jgi:hypothetical protein